MTVPPPEIAANRSLLAVLVATNFLGMNTPAIAATEAQYAEMWAQDAVAMYGYAGSSAAATVLTPFTSPLRTPIRAERPARPPRSARPAAPLPATRKAPYRCVPQALSAARRHSRPDDSPLDADTLSNLITIFLSAPTDLSYPFRDHPGGCALWRRWIFPSAMSALCPVRTRMTSSAAGRREAVLASSRRRTGTAVSGDSSEPAPRRGSCTDDVGGPGRGEHDRGAVGAVGTGPSPRPKYAPSQ